jgi:hypothetical protein
MSVTLEDLGSNVTQHWNNNKTIVTFKMSDSKRSSVDAYIEGNLDVLKTWDKSKPLYTIQDIANPAVTLTPYLKQRLNEITDYVKSNQITVRSAIVMENNFTGQVMRAFGRLFTINARYLKQLYFTDMSKAQEWIKQQENQN